MPNESPNTRLLAAILEDLDTIIEEQSKGNKNSGNEKEVNVKVEGAEEVVALLTGLSIFNSEKEVQNTADQLKDIINILDKLSSLDSKKIDSVAKSVSQLMDAFTKLDIKEKNTSGLANISDFLVKAASIESGGIQNLTIIAATLTPAVAQQISDFVNSLNIKKKTTDNASNVLLSLAAVLHALNNIDLSKIDKQLEIIKKLDGVTGERLAEFMKSIDKSVFESDPKKIKQGLMCVENIAKIIMLMTGAIAVLTLLTLIDMEAVKVSVGIMILILGAIIGTIYVISKNQKDVHAGFECLITIGKAILMITGAIGLLTLMAALDLTATLTGTGIALTILAAITGIVILLSKKGKELNGGLDGLITIGKSVLMITGVIAILTLLAMFDLTSTLAASGIAIVLILVFASVACWLTGDKDKQMKDGVNALKTLTDAVLALVGAIAIMTLLVAFDLKDVLISTGIVIAIVVALVGIACWLTGDKEKEIKQGVNGLKMLTTALLMVVVAIGIMVLLINIAPVSDVLIATGIVIGIVVVLSLMVKLIASNDEKQIKRATQAIAAIILCLVAISVVALFMFKPIAEQAGEIIPGALLVLGIVALMGLMVWGLSRINGKDLKEASLALLAITACILAISMIALYLFIPIGQKWKEILPGAIVVLGIIGVMGLMVWGLSNIDNKDLKWGLIVLGSLTLIVLVISMIALFLFIPIGQKWDEIAAGGLVVLGIIGIMTAIVYGISKFSKKDILYGEYALGIMTAIVLAISIIAREYFIPIYDDAEAVLVGGGIIVGIITVMGLIVIGLGKIDKKMLIQGGLVVAGIGGLLWLLSATMDPFIDLCIKVNENARAIASGGLEIVGILVSFGVIMGGIGALMLIPIIPVVLAAGAAVLSGIAGTIALITACMNPYIDLALKLRKAGNIKKEGKKIIELLKLFGEAMTEIGLMSLWPPTMAGLTSGAYVMGKIADCISYISNALKKYLEVLAIQKQYTLGDIRKFNNFIVGKEGFAGSVTNIIDQLEKVGVISAAKAAHISVMIRPIFETIKQFMQIIENFANMKYVSAWDKDGNPAEYSPITAQMFKDAAHAISSSFSIFLIQLSTAFKTFNKKTVYVMNLIKDSIGPVMKSVGNFTDAIMSALTTQIPCEWDKEGKPIKFKPFDSSEFARAANVIAGNFGTFLETLAPVLQNLPVSATIAIDLMKQGIEPVMNAVATYSDTIMSFAAGKEVEYTDANGNTLKKIIEIDPEKYTEAATKIGDAFSKFIKTLSDKFVGFAYGGERVQTKDGGWFGDDEYTVTERGNKVADLISGLSGIKDVIEGMGTLLDVIVKATTEYGDINLESAADTATKPLIKFIDKLVAKIGTKQQADQVQQINTSLGKLKNTANTYKQIFDILMKVYKDNNADFEGMTTLITGFIDYFIGTELITKYTTLSSTIDNTINPVLEKMAKVFSFFDTLQLETDNTAVSIDIKHARKNTELLCGIINDFASAIERYQSISSDVNLQFLAKLATNIEQTYVTTSDSYQKYEDSFFNITARFKNLHKIQYRPMMADIINLNIKLLRVFKELDRELINKERQRNRALQTMANNIRKVGSEILDVANNLKAASESAAALKQTHEELTRARQEQTNEALTHSVKTGLSTWLNPNSNKPEVDKSQSGKKDENTDPIAAAIDAMSIKIAQAVAQGIAAALSKPYDVTFTSTDKQTTHYRANPQRH